MGIEIKYQTNGKYNLKKNENKILQQRIDSYIQYIELIRSYVETENRIKALEEKADNKIFLVKCFRKQSVFYKRILFKTVRKVLYR